MTDEKIIKLKKNLEVRIGGDDHIIACPECAIGTVRPSLYTATQAVALKGRCLKCAKPFEIVPAKKILGTEDPWEREVQI